MKRSRRELSIDMVIDKLIFKNNKMTFYLFCLHIQHRNGINFFFPVSGLNEARDKSWKKYELIFSSMRVESIALYYLLVYCDLRTLPKTALENYISVLFAPKSSKLT